LPVAGDKELATVVDKIARHLRGPLGESAQGERAPDEACRRRQLLLSADRSRAAQSRRWRLLQKLEGLDIDIRTAGPEPDPKEGNPGGEAPIPPDQALVAALTAGPDWVHFDGHGGRFMWQLGGAYELAPHLFFELDDLERAGQPVPDRLPVMLAVSCATAPFDHPQSSSLGEGLVLAEGQGAVAYIGASVRLVNPPRVSPIFVESLVTEATVGEALVRAKRSIGWPSISYLYNLIGDPALPLARRPGCSSDSRD